MHPEILKKDKDFRAASDAAREAFAEMPAAEIIDMQKKFVKAMGGAFIDKMQKMKNARREAARVKRIYQEDSPKPSKPCVMQKV